MTLDPHEPATPPAAFPAASDPAPENKDVTQKPAPQELRQRTKKTSRGVGKIARLPNATHARLNLMLRDGLKYKEILAQLGDEAKGIVPRNLSTWLKSQQWLAEQDWRESLRADQQSAFGLVDNFDASKFNEAALQLAITRLFLALRHLESGDLNQRLGGNALCFARLVSALARACRETTHIEKFRQVADALAAQANHASRQGSSYDPLRDIVNKWDQAFGHRQPIPMTNASDSNANGSTDDTSTPSPPAAPSPGT